MPILVGSRGKDAFSGFGGVEATPGAQPAVLADEASSGGDGGKDPIDALGVQGEGAQGHVTERGVLDHAADGGDFVRGELRRSGVRAARPVVEGAVVGEVAPGVEAGWREAQDAQGNGERDGLLGRSDGGQDRTLGLALGHALGIEAEAREPDEEKGQADDGEEDSYSASKSENLSLKFGTIHGEDIGGDDGPRAAPNLADRGGTWNSELTKQVRVALLTGEVTHPVVVRAVAGGGRHGAW